LSFFLKSSKFFPSSAFSGEELSQVNIFRYFLLRVKDFLAGLACFRFDQTRGKAIDFSQKWVFSEICSLKSINKPSNLNLNPQKKRTDSYSFWMSQLVDCDLDFIKKSSQDIKKRLQHSQEKKGNLLSIFLFVLKFISYWILDLF